MELRPKSYTYPFRSLVLLLAASWIMGLTGCSTELPEKVAIAYQDLPEVIDYNFHIKPILSDRCYQCHGPDDKARKSNFRLDTEEGAFAELEKSGGHAWVKKNLGKSVAWRRVMSEDPQIQMPPPESNLLLTDSEKALITKWIEQGAQWKEHWSFIPPKNPQVPQDFPSEWTPTNPIDNYIYSKLHQVSLHPSPSADKERLLRRVTMDITGLPPTLEEIDNFLLDQSPDAYEKVVDRLLNSDSYGERMAMEWMDLSRYADSHGMHADGSRMMWPWRDWVISAFNKNMAYDEFVTWQLAGDLLANATKEQILATAFHRNHTMTAEGGVVDEEFRLEYVADRTNTTATAFLGLTMECAKCHDHKFDPIMQEEYYKMSAFFNNVKELGMTGDDGNYGPMLLLPDSAQEIQLAVVEKKIHAKERDVELSLEAIKKIKDYAEELTISSKPNGLIAYYPFESSKLIKQKNGRTRLVLDGNDKSFSNGEPENVPGKVGNAVSFQGGYNEIYLLDVGAFDINESYSATSWIYSKEVDAKKTQTIMGTAGNKNQFWRGWDFYLDESNRLSLRLIHALPTNYIHVTSVKSIELDAWSHVAFTYDGSLKASGIKLYINGEEVELTTKYDHLYKSIVPYNDEANKDRGTRAVRVGKNYRAFTGEDGIFSGKIDEIQFYERRLSALEVRSISGLQRAPKKEEQMEHAIIHDKVYQNKMAELSTLRKERLFVLQEIPEIMVMEEMPDPRSTYLLNRGQYDLPGKKVSIGTPEKVLPFSDDLPKNRLGLAEWLFDDQNPLTARVAVNRYWQLLFGRGIVSTLNDFGSQGSLPTHPQLLDWLAVSFRESGWDVKNLVKTMVMSSTYRQSSVVNDLLKEKDPDNRLYARASSYRLSAEMIRDNALAASGLLTKKIGGESVKPYQPDSLWIELGNFSADLLYYRQDSGDDLYRRSIYTFIRRTAPPPFMTTFDAPNREICTVQRERTNTPLQALVLLNDPQFVEASRVLAERVQEEAGDDLSSMMTQAFRLVTGRKLNADELAVFKDLYQTEYQRFQQTPGEVESLLAVGERKVSQKYSPITTAALTMVTSTMLNHDEAYMKR